MPIYLLYGDETYLLNKEIKSLREKVINPEMAALSHKILRNPSIPELMEAIGTVSFNLWGETLIEIQDFQPLEKAINQESDKKLLEEAKALLETVNEQKHLLFINKKIDRKVSFAKWFTSQKQMTIREFKKLEFWKTDEAAQLLIQDAKHQGIQLTVQAANLLVETMGVDLQPLVNEVQKLFIYTAGRAIGPEDVKALSNHNDNTFTMLNDWIHGRNRSEVYQILEEILLKQHPVQLFGVAQSYLNNIFRLKLWQNLGYSEGEMADRLKKHPFKVKKDLADFASVPLQRLSHLKELILELEWKSKTGQLNDRIAFEILMGA
jgi:DNA polymerase-3 subunit delta